VGVASTDSATQGVTLGDQVKALLNALNHYTSTHKDKREVFPIVIVHDQAVPAVTIAEVRSAFEGNESVTVGKAKFSVVVIPFTTKDELHKKLVDIKAAAVFITEGNEKCIREITATTQEMKILSMTNVSDYVHWLGVTLGVEDDSGKLKVMVNLAGCQNEKIDFDETVLGEASVYF